jgi:nitroreductase
MSAPAPAPHTAPGDLLHQLHWRYATKRFDPARRIPEDTWAVLEQSLVLAPSSFGLQPWRFIIVTDPEVRSRLRAAARNQPQITEASHLVVFQAMARVDAAHVDAHLAVVAEKRRPEAAALAAQRQRLLDTVVNDPQRGGSDAWAARQVYIALGQFLTAAAVLGVDACPMEGFERTAYDAILNAPDAPYRSVVIAPAGYRAADDPAAAQAKVRFPASAVIIHR